MAEPVTVVDLLRHGACQGGEIFLGATDVALSGEGWQQMRRAVQGKQQWHRIITSPLQRCHSFAAEQASYLDVPLLVEEHWREIDFGVWEGRQISEVWASEAENITRYFSDPESFTPEDGEPILLARKRLKSGWESVLQRHPGEHLLLVQHGGTIRLLLGLLLDMPVSSISRFEVPYGSLTRVKVFHSPAGDRPVIVSHNPLSHS